MHQVVRTGGKNISNKSLAVMHLWRLFSFHLFVFTSSKWKSKTSKETRQPWQPWFTWIWNLTLANVRNFFWYLSSHLQRAMAGWAPVWLLPHPSHLKTVGYQLQRRKRPVLSSEASLRQSSTAPWKKLSVSLLTPRQRLLFSKGSPSTSTQKYHHPPVITDWMSWTAFSKPTTEHWNTFSDSGVLTSQS